MRILVDTDVLIDLALDREPFAGAAAQLLDTLERRPGTACIAWHSVSNFFYLVSPKLGKRRALQFLVELTGFIQVSPTTTWSLLFAVRLPLADFEDAMQVAAAEAFQAEMIATRNLRDYAQSPIPAKSPTDVLQILRDHS